MGNEKMKILWIGEMLSPKLEQLVLDKGGAVMSALISEKNLVSGIDALDIEMDSINSCQISVTCKVPRKAMKVIPEYKWSRNGTSKDFSVPYRNVKYFDMIFRANSLKRAAKHWATENRHKEKIGIIVYNMHSPYIQAAIEVKRIIPEAKIFLIVTDLPLYMDLEMKRLKKLLKRIDWLNMQYNLCKHIDKYILYATPMAEYLHIKTENWMLMEGSYDPSILPAICEDVSDNIIVMYSGALHFSFGIDELLKAMDLLDSHYELWLTGKGTAVDYIIQKAERDQRIKYLGFLPSRRDLLEKQSQATMLINLRKKEEIASKYCFPSKLFEFMASGKPVLSCKLEGIPEEYFHYLIEMRSITAEDIAASIQKVARMEKNDRMKLGIEGRDYILNEKNKYIQSKKIMNFIKNAIEERNKK